MLLLFGIDKDIIEGCLIMLPALSSGYNNNVQKFKAFALETAKELTNRYSWNYLPAAANKILIHINFSLYRLENYRSLETKM